jgi:hypothetical protein
LSPACHFCRQPHPDIDLVPADGFPAAHALAVKGKYKSRPSAAKAGIDSAGFMRGLKPPPPSAQSFPQTGKLGRFCIGNSARPHKLRKLGIQDESKEIVLPRLKPVSIVVGFMRGLKPPPPSDICDE